MLGANVELPEWNAATAQLTQQAAKAERAAKRRGRGVRQSRAEIQATNAAVVEGLKAGIIEQPRGSGFGRSKGAPISTATSSCGGEYSKSRIFFPAGMPHQCMSTRDAAAYVNAQLRPSQHGGLVGLAADAATTASTVISSLTQGFKDVWGTVKGTPKQPTPKPSPAPQPESNLVPIVLVGAAAVGVFLIIRSMKKKGRK